MSNTPGDTLPDLAFSDMQSLEKALLAAGISAPKSQELAELGRPSFFLQEPKETRNFYRDRLFSKLGGTPDFPDGMKWPFRPREIGWVKDVGTEILKRLLKGKRPLSHQYQMLGYCTRPQPYSFIAQISFREMAAAGASDLDLPESGAIYLFYDAVLQSWGFDPREAGGFKVIYAPETKGAAPAARPAFHAKVPTFNEKKVEPSRYFQHCPPGSFHFEMVKISEEDRDKYCDFHDAVINAQSKALGGGMMHKFGGWANHTQNPMEEQCALVTGGVDCGGPTYTDQALVRQLLDAPNDWTLLLQIDSDPDIGLMWGDAGRLYLWIKTSDLQQRKFDNTWLILQC